MNRGAFEDDAPHTSGDVEMGSRSYPPPRLLREVLACQRERSLAASGFVAALLWAPGGRPNSPSSDGIWC